ncbi:tetratricopeptide repeat protein, partial [Bacteroides congonensis]|uniref:tetratricopeptide repeat protein n=1 Tax=Bacteroides congonensis TaxID=1871006 RepID=UPI00265858BD
MKGKYSRQVKTAVKLIWSSFDRDEIRRGYSILILEAQKGDADALAFIARCFMGESYVWPQAGFKADDENASKLMQKSAMMGSATGVLCAARSANLTPSVERAMPFASFKEAFEEILGQAERGDAFCCYMVGNVYYWGDYLRVEPDYAKQFKDESDYNAWAWPIAKAWYERSFDGGLCAGWGNYCDIRKSGLCEIAQDVFEKYYLKLADISPVICNNYGYYLRTEKGDSYGGLLRYVEAARRGDPQAAYNAGHIYEAGEEVDENIDLAYQLYEMAAKCGHPAGQFEVGYYLFEGFGDVEQDYAKAVEWFEKAYQNPKCSKTTRTQTAAYLGLCYQEGLGTVQDDDVAFEYLHEAGEDIDNLWESITVKVLTALGVAYAFGRGTETDIELGYQYLEDAAKLGSEEAKKYISYINSPDYEADERKKEEPATPVAPFWQNVAEKIRDAVAADLR